jgi:helicase
MVSFHYARQMKERPRLPLMVDSGGFAALFEGSEVKEVNGLGTIERRSEEGTVENLQPRDVLDFQEVHADVAFTLDFPIPPKTDGEEARRRQDLTLANAKWALRNRRRADLRLYACVQAWDPESARHCAEEYRGLGFDGVAIGGLVPRAQNPDLVFSIVEAVRNVLPDLPLHVFGLGHPVMVRELFRRGVQSVDSSSYVKLAAEGRAWGAGAITLTDPSPAERLGLAIRNLATASGATLPLSMLQRDLS